ncbi:MAG: flagellar basal body L-ring protein FlgH [Mariprofundaceae bacterium]
MRAQMFKLSMPLLLGLLMAGCMPTARSVTQDVNRNLIEQAMETPRQNNTESGSLWNNSGSKMFTDPRARDVGDLITILVVESASATRSLGTKKSKSSSRKTGLDAFLGAETNIFPKAGITPSAAVDISDSKNFDGSGSTTNSDTLQASVTAVVTKVYPNGNMKILGRRQVTINHQPQELSFSGIVRPLDISPDNTITSAKVAQAVISYGGGGELATVAHEGWLGRTLDQVWPF